MENPYRELSFVIYEKFKMKFDNLINEVESNEFVDEVIDTFQQKTGVNVEEVIVDEGKTLRQSVREIVEVHLTITNLKE